MVKMILAIDSSFLVALCAVLGIPAFYLFYRGYSRSRKVAQMESALPSALFLAASFPRRTPVEKIFEEIAQGGFGPLGGEFSKAHRQMRSGVPAGRAIADLGERNRDSLLLLRVCSLFSNYYRSGFDLSASLREIAEESFSLSALAREQSASLALHKYTLLIAGGIMVPLVLGFVSGTVSSLKSSLGPDAAAGAGGQNGFLTGGSAAERLELQQAVLAGQRVYLALFAVLASLFVAMSEGNWKKFVVYAAGLLPLSQLLFLFSSGI